MSTEILVRINYARERWAREYGHYPTRLYVGAVEHKSLKELAAKFCVVKTADMKLKRERVFYDGMEAFLVDAESHIDFGSHGPPPSPAG